MTVSTKFRFWTLPCTTLVKSTYSLLYNLFWPPLWSSGQSFWLQIQRSRVRFPALPDFLSSSGSRTGSTQPREVNWGATWIKSSGSGPENGDYRPWGSVALTTWHPSIRKSWETSPTGGGRSVGIVRSRTRATEFYYYFFFYNQFRYYYPFVYGCSNCKDPIPSSPLCVTTTFMLAGKHTVPYYVISLIIL